jgi:hypothetical protein
MRARGMLVCRRCTLALRLVVGSLVRCGAAQSFLQCLDLGVRILKTL